MWCRLSARKDFEVPAREVGMLADDTREAYESIRLRLSLHGMTPIESDMLTLIHQLLEDLEAASQACRVTQTPS